MPDTTIAGFPATSTPGLRAAHAPAHSLRRLAISEFLAASGWGDVCPEPLAGDASFRSYYRLRRDDESAVVMDAPPPEEDVAPYVAVAEILRGLGLSAPEIMAADHAHGFLLIEDFGDDTYTRLLQRGADESSLYTLAIEVLAALQTEVAATGLPELPPYDEDRLLAEAVLLVDWYMPAVLKEKPLAARRDEYLGLWRALLPMAHALPPTLVLRDFHIDNLMLLPGRPGVRACGLLDFQDAVIGSPAYDLVSLLEDARRDVPETLRQAMTERYLTAVPALDANDFRRAAAILAVQRNCKILGIFTRLWLRDGKPAYLAHIPRLWRLVEQDLQDPSLQEIRHWLDRNLPPVTRRIPDLRMMA
jgi:aminoglycoside/choline kinase family phosphotransferase